MAQKKNARSVYDDISICAAWVLIGFSMGLSAGLIFAAPLTDYLHHKGAIEFRYHEIRDEELMRLGIGGC